MFYVTLRTVRHNNRNNCDDFQLKEEKEGNVFFSFFLSCGGGRFTPTHTKVVKEIRKNRRVFLGKSFQAQKGRGENNKRKRI